MIWFTSDLHFNHENIIRYCDRPWPNVLDMNEGLVERWNSVVGNDDTVWVLGDLVMGRIGKARPWLEELKGNRKILVPGNHDACWRHGKKVRDRDVLTNLGFDVWGSDWLNIIDTPEAPSPLTCTLCHFPWVSEFPGDERYADYRAPDNGQWLLHGHIHNQWKVRGRMINVGVDVWNYTPVSMRTILDIIG